MEYYAQSPDPEAAQYQQYQYTADFHQPSPPASFPGGEGQRRAEGDDGDDFDGVPGGFGGRAAAPPPPPPTAAEEPRAQRGGEPRPVDARGIGPPDDGRRAVREGTVYKKAPGAPKRFKSSYVHFFTNFVEKKKHQLGPDGLPLKLDISTVSGECSQAWKALPAAHRKYWDDVSEQEKREYFKQKESYQGPWRIATSKMKRKKDGAPKRSPSAFFLFVNARRPVIKAQHPDMANTELVKACSEMWNTAPASEKTPYLEEERKLRAQYHVEAEIWKKQLQERKEREEEVKRGEKKSAKKGRAVGEEAMPSELTPRAYMDSSRYPPPIKSAATASRGRKRKKDPNAPKRSPPAFFLFVNHCRPELKLQYPELRHTELVKMLGQKWAQMSEEEKRPFRDHEEQLRQQYHIDIELYKKGAVPEHEYVPAPKPPHASGASVLPQDFAAPRHGLNYQPVAAQGQTHLQQPDHMDPRYLG